MEIKNLNNRMINAYKTVGGGVQSKGKGSHSEAEKAGSGDNFDKIEFDFGRSAKAAKADISVLVSANADNARIEQLQVDYEGDNLPTTPEQIAGSIVG
ncbi:MAG: hypothetical protein FWG70_04770 [Oscillospiraceae bacterium]|nr:hypothetical protein [Oscillospiraceae bacterium]